MGWNIGYQSTFPEQLIRRLTAARMSVQMGVSARTAERYIPEETRYEAEAKLDQEMRSSCLGLIDKHAEQLEALNESARSRPALGLIIGDNGIAAARYSVKLCFDLADIGSLYQTSAVARSCLEQLAWSNAVAKLDDIDKIQNISAQSQIAQLSKVNASSGRLYGWFSRHSHWAYDAHWKSFDEIDGKVAVINRSVHYKVQSYAALIVLSRIFCDVVCAQLASRSSENKIRMEPGPFSDLMATLISVVSPSRQDRATSDEIRNLADILALSATPNA